MGKYWSLLAAAVISITAGCSPYNYSAPLADLNDSVTGLTSSVTSAHQQLVQDVSTNRRLDLVYNQPPVALSRTCTPGTVISGKDDPPCTVYRVGGTPVALDPEPISPRLKDTLTALKNYVASLAAITKASDRTDFQTAVAAAAKSVSGLMATVPGMGTAAAPIAAAGINVFGWLVGTGLDIQRFETLKKFVNYVDQAVGPTDEKAMDVISAYLGVSIATLVVDRRNQLYPEAQFIRARIGPGMSQDTYRARLADLEAITSTMDGLRQVDPITTAQGLATAHKALVDAVNNPKLDLSDLIQTIGDFKDKVSALQTALAAASTPAKTASTTTSK